MQDEATDRELRERLSIIENMMAEGRRITESWGWTFVLWGVAFYLALACAALGHTPWAWPVTMSTAAIVTVVIACLKTGNHPRTTLAHAVGSIWIALGISMFLLLFALGLSGRLTDPHLFVAVISAILGMANAASGMILRWKIQFACALVWWATVVASSFGTDAQSMIVFLIAIFLCQIVFGIYGMITEAQVRKQRSLVHV